MPSYEQFIQGGRINNPNFQRMLSYADCAMFLMERNIPLGHVDLTMDGEQYLLKQLPPGPSWTIHTQMPVTPQNFKTWYDGIIERGGEGVVVREKYSSWAPRRLSCVIKYKAENDTEGTVIGYQAGKGKHQGRLGSLLIRCEDLPGQPVLSLSGFSDDERYLDSAEAIDWASQHPGAEMPFDCSRFPRGTKVTFKYRGLSAAGVPLEARYWRKYHE
jgi:DNA ligase-1